VNTIDGTVPGEHRSTCKTVTVRHSPAANVTELNAGRTGYSAADYVYPWRQRASLAQIMSESCHDSSCTKNRPWYCAAELVASPLHTYSGDACLCRMHRSLLRTLALGALYRFIDIGWHPPLSHTSNTHNSVTFRTGRTLIRFRIQNELVYGRH
jgi:hypothetical protein